MSKYSYTVLLLLFSSLCSFAQQAESFRVDSASRAYRHIQRDSTALKTADMIELSDSVSIKNYGILRIARSGQQYEEYGPRDVKTVKELFFSNKISGIMGRVKGLITGRIKPLKVSGYNSVHIHRVYGDEDDIKDSLDVVFYCDGKSYSSFNSLPPDSKFDIIITNTSTSVKVYSILFTYKTKADNNFTSVIIDSELSNSPLDYNPILLAPGETVTIPATFRRLDGYFPYRLNIYGSDEFFIMKKYSRDAGKVDIYSDEVFVNDHNTVERYYFEYSDE